MANVAMTFSWYSHQLHTIGFSPFFKSTASMCSFLVQLDALWEAKVLDPTLVELLLKHLFTRWALGLLDVMVKEEVDCPVG